MQAKKWTNKTRVLVLAARGVSYRYVREGGLEFTAGTKCSVNVSFCTGSWRAYIVIILKGNFHLNDCVSTTSPPSGVR